MSAVINSITRDLRASLMQIHMGKCERTNSQLLDDICFAHVIRLVCPHWLLSSVCVLSAQSDRRGRFSFVSGFI